jgi:hypothetical protein
MTSFQTLEERTTALEYAVFEQFPPTMEAMMQASTQIYAVTVENKEAMAGLRVDMAHLQTSVHHDMTALHASVHREVAALHAGVHRDVTALHTTVHGDVTALKLALDLQGDRMRENLAVATAEFRVGMTGVRETMSLRFQKVDGHFKGVHGDIANLQEDVTGLKQEVTGLKQDVTGLKQDVAGLNDKLDLLIAEIRSDRS